MENSIFYCIFYPSEKPVVLHLLRYQVFDVKNYYFTLDALDLEYYKLLQHWGLQSAYRLIVIIVNT